MKVDSLPDEALLERIAARDAEALEAFYERHAQLVYNLLLRIVRSPELADELLQETFWQVWRKAEGFEGSGAPAAWLCRIARNKALDNLRRQKARPQPQESADETTEEQLSASIRSADSDVSSHVEQRLDRQRIMRALNSIPAEQRQCLEMAYFEGMSQSQIAEATGAPLGTIKTRIRMGLQKLERLMRAADP